MIFRGGRSERAPGRGGLRLRRREGIYYTRYIGWLVEFRVDASDGGEALLRACTLNWHFGEEEAGSDKEEINVRL